MDNEENGVRAESVLGEEDDEFENWIDFLVADEYNSKENDKGEKELAID